MTDYYKLGLPGDLREYTVRSIGEIQAALANPFAARVDTSSEFGALDAYSEWVVENWEAGVGKRDPAAGGMLYSHMDTRFPNQMILPLGFEYPYSVLHPSSGVNYTPGDHTVAVGNTVAVSYTPAANATIGVLWVFVDAPDGTVVTLAFYSNNADNTPNALLATGTATVVKHRPGPTWLYVTTAALDVTAGTIYHLGLSGTDILSVPYTATGGTAHMFNGSAWVPAPAGFSWFSSYVKTTNNLVSQTGYDILSQVGNSILLAFANVRLRHIVTTGSRVFAAYSNTVVELTGNTLTTLTNTGSANITDMIAANGVVYVAYGGGYKTYTLATGAVADVSSTPTTLMLVWGRYLWRTYQNDLYYYDGSVWTQVEDIIGPDGYEVRGMEGLGDNLYLSTDLGLYALMPGDFVEPVTKWPTTDARNGIGMVEWMGALYIPVAEDIIRFGQDGATVQVGLRTGEELPNDIQGTVYRLATTNYFLLASVEPKDDNGAGSLWAYNGEGWHGIGLHAPGVKGGAILVDTTTGYLYWGGGYGLIARAKYPSNVVNPIRDRGEKLFARTGWVEQDRFYGNFRRLIKDFESVYLDTESISGGAIAPYWKDDESTDWELLGTVTTDDTETRWADRATRPQSKWLRLGLLMRTDDKNNTPILRAHSLKFHAMTNDRWRWPLLIPISANQQQLDGTLNSYTVAQRKAHMESLIFSDEPFLLEDVDGLQYWVKVVTASRGVARVEWIDGAKSIDYLYALTLEQLTAGTYAA